MNDDDAAVTRMLLHAQIWVSFEVQRRHFTRLAILILGYWTARQH